MNLANLITLSRIVITAASFTCLELIEDPNNLTPADVALVWWAFSLFIFAAATDFLDGYFARKHGQVTAFGRVADPFADKVLVCGILVILLKFDAAYVSLMDTWYVVVILAREFLVTTIRGLAESQGVQFPAERLGKYKMVAQCFAASCLMTVIAGTDFWMWLTILSLWVTLVLTLVSAVQYVVRARPLLFA